MHFRPHLLLLCLFGSFSVLWAQPTDNPVETRYPGLYPWSASIQWNRIVNILDHGAVADGITPNDAAFVSARDAVAAAGGGVLYIPAGDYYFADSIGLVDHVVVRGDNPGVADATDPDFRPSTRLIFPKFYFVASGSGTDPDTAFKGIGMVSGQSGINTGLVNLDINRASIYAGGYGSGSENVVIMGIRSNNVASEQPWTVPTPEQNAWQIHPNRFVSNISAFAYRNVLVANCMLNDAHYWLHRQEDGKDLTGAPADLASLEIDDFEQPGYLIDDGGTWRSVEDVFGTAVPGAVYTFDYTNHYGINVQGSTGEWGAPPWVQPNLFYAGAVIRDNWVYCTMRVKIDASGRGLVIKDNILKDRSGKRYFVHPNGDKKVQNAATLENRGIDWRGHDVLIEGNEIEVFRHKLGTGAYSSVDGEGILHQEVHGTTIDGLTIRNNTANAYIGIWKMPYTRNVLIEDNTLTGPGYIIVQSDTNGADFPMYNTIVRNNIVDGGISISADYYSPGVLSANVYDNQLDGTLAIEDHAIHSGNTKLDGATPATVDVRTGAVGIAPPAEGILYADADPDALDSGDPVRFTVLVTTPAIDVERVRFYRHKTLMHTDATPPYTYDWTSDGMRGLWSAKIEQPEQPGGFDPYTALMLDPDPAWASPPAITLTGPDPAGTYVTPEDLQLTAGVTAGGSAIEAVEFYAGGFFLGADADGTAPFELLWSGVPRGIYSLTAKVRDASGAVVVSDPVEIDVEGIPDAAPHNLVAAAYSDSEIDLSWENAATNATGFDIERSPAGAGTWSLVDSVDVPVTDYRDSGLSSDTGYDYRVIATNAHGFSDPSNVATAVTYPSAFATPGAPTGFIAFAMNADRIQLEWQAAVGEPFGYVLEQRTTESDPWTSVVAINASRTTFLHSGLPSETAIQYRLKAWNNTGESNWVRTSAATFGEGYPQTFSPTGNPFTIPGRIQFEDYNVSNGYYDTTGGNEGSSDYRHPDDVDMGGSEGNVTIGWIANGEWLDYSVRIETAGLYDVTVRYASPNSEGSLSLKLDGGNIAPAMVFADTGDWGAYQDHLIEAVYLPAGHFILRAYVENSGFNLDYVDFALVEAATYATWQQAHLSGEPASGASDNPDGDPYTNEFDMLLGLDPLMADAAQTGPDIEGGNGTLIFPLAKGLDGVSWLLHYSHDPGQAGGWSSVAEDQFEVVSEEAARVWLRAVVPMGGEDGIFFRFEIAP